MKTLSVIIPNYNNSAYLAKCLDSVLSQTYPIEEVVVYDDCSTDNSRELLKEYALKDSRIRLILPDENKGVSIARDTAIRSCHTDYVTTLDADDFYYDNDKLMREMTLVNETTSESSRLVCTFSQTVSVNEAGEPFGDMTIKDLQHNFRFRTVTFLIGSLVARDLCFPLEVYKAVDGFIPDMKLFEDWNLSLKMLGMCDFLFTGGYGTAYRHKSYGLSHVDFKKIFLGKIRAFKMARPYTRFTFSETIVFYLRSCYCFLLDAYLNFKNR